ncbi:MAG TPA: TlpA disulfide reductase family protein [Planctomycetia bacterium]|nr:TlpA disulfide reductase family protein [Planctomycetia bacterium]
MNLAWIALVGAVVAGPPKLGTGYSPVVATDLERCVLNHYFTPERSYSLADFEWKFSAAGFVIASGAAPVPKHLVDLLVGEGKAASKIEGKWKLTGRGGLVLFDLAVDGAKKELPEKTLAVYRTAPTVVRIGDPQHVFACMAPALAEVELKEIDLKGLEEFVAKQKGKPVIFDVWATWCLPCREKFPKYLKFAEKHANDAAFATLTIDDPDKTKEAKEFLVAKKSTLPNFRFSGETEVIEKKLGFEGVPTYLVFDKEGKLIERFNDLAKMEKKAEELFGSEKK